MQNERYYPRAARCAAESRASWGLTGYPLASVFAPLQEFSEIYDPENALERGTIFKELDLPFGRSGGKGGSCRG